MRRYSRPRASPTSIFRRALSPGAATSAFAARFLAAAVALSCGGGGKAAPPASERDAVLEGWRQAGLTVSAFTVDKSGAIGADCTTGTVSAVDVTVCSFSSDAEATAAKAKGLEWIGAATGASLTRGKLVLAVTDRRNADPSGRTINTITKTFRGK